MLKYYVDEYCSESNARLVAPARQQVGQALNIENRTETTMMPKTMYCQREAGSTQKR